MPPVVVPRRWYLAPRYYVAPGAAVYDPATGTATAEVGTAGTRRECPGTLRGGEIVPHVPSGATCRAYDAEAGTVLVGLRPGGGAPASDWQPLTLAQARERFAAVYGRKPSPREVL